MSKLSCGIVGLPNVGKSTIFNALTKNQIPSENYPFCTIEPNEGTVCVKDERLNILSDIPPKSKKIVPAIVTFKDIAGLVKGASKGEGLGNKFLTNIKETDAIIHVVRCFEDENVTHVEGNVDPIRDIEIIELELILSDLSQAENTLAKLEKMARIKKEILPEVNLFKKIINHLNENKLLRSLFFSEEEEKLMKKHEFLTTKKVLYVANVSEKDLFDLENAKYFNIVKEYAEKENNKAIAISGKIEQEIAQLNEEEAKEFLKELNLEKPGLDRLVRSAYDMLDLITFITHGEIETRAWTIKKGQTALEAAGKIHTDIKNGFIKAEVVSYNDIIKYKGRVGAREAGHAQIHGKEYIVQDGDVILFFHN